MQTIEHKIKNEIKKMIVNKGFDIYRKKGIGIKLPKEIFWILFSLLPLMSFTQVNITGIVKDGTQPISYANVVLTNSSGSVITGVITKDNGSFNLEVKEGSYIMKITFLGYRNWQKNITVTKNIDLGTIILEPQDNKLNEVVITAKKRLIEKKIDRLVFNVKNSVAVTGGTAMDALRLTPRIRVLNDEISMIGKGNIIVTVDDRIVRLSGADLANYLRTFNAEDIDKIEVIANPPAKYSAEGNSGVLNIVTNSIESDSWNANVRSVYRQATYSTGNYGGGIDFQKGKLELTSNIKYKNGSNAPIESNKILYPSQIWDSETNRRDFRNNLYGRLGINYEINNKLKTGFNLNYVNTDLLIKAEDRTDIFSRNSNVLDSILLTNSRDTRKVERKSLNYYAVFKIDTLGKKASLDINLFSYGNERNRPFITETLQSDFTPTESALVEARNAGIQDIENYSVNVDMEHPTEWAQLNYGGRISNVKTRNSFKSFNTENGVETVDLTLRNKFQYEEGIQALYFSGQKKFSDKWEAKFGARYEWTQTEGFSGTNNQLNVFNYSKLFPTFYLSYIPNNNHSLSINYGRRIQRPNFRLLNPFRVTINPFSFHQGNPFLQPAFTDNVELGYSFKGNLITNVYFSHTNDDFEKIALLDAETNIRKVIPLNFITNRTVGINQTYITNPFKWWEINASADVYYTSTDSKIPEALQFLSGWNGTFSFSNNFDLNSDKTFLANFNYLHETKGVYHLNEYTSYQQLNASLKYILMDGDLTLSLYANDIFRTSLPRFTSVTNGIVNSSQNYYDEQYFRLGVLYDFGKSLKVNTRNIKNREELSRSN